MRAPWVVLSLSWAFCAMAKDAPPSEPKLLSVHPSAGQRGAAYTAIVRGSGLRGASAAFLEDGSLAISITGAGTEAPTGRSKTPTDLVHVRFDIASDAKPGRHFFRLVAPGGVSNSIPIHVSEEPVRAEPPGSHETPDSATIVGDLPAVFAGCIAKRGETDYYSVEANADETITFEVFSGVPSAGFDPSITVYERSGSWFDPARLNRIGFNDEPLWVANRPMDAYLVQRFPKAGKYLVRIEAFSGLGGPDYSYQLRIRRGSLPLEEDKERGSWEERRFTRSLSANRLNELAARGGKPQDHKSIETYPATPEAPLFKFPGSLMGALTTPGEAHKARFAIDGPRDIAIEVETPAAAPPLFNPIVRLLDTSGAEVATNVFTGRGDCSGELSKSLQAKTIVPLRNPGEYTVEIRETAADLAGPDFRYRVQVRPQVPHVGQVRIDDDKINLAPGAAKTARVFFDREEDFRGAVAVFAESLPPGVEATAGADFEPDKDPPRFPGKRERYTPRTERAVVVFAAADGAPAMERPQLARLVVRSVVDGRPGAPLATKEIPVMVVSKP
jgi:hypothetical protein